MAIQIPNPGTGNGASGDNEFVLWSKVKDNFSDATHAASKLVGTGAEQVPQNKHLGTAATKNVGAATGQIPLVENVSAAVDVRFNGTYWVGSKVIDADSFEYGSKYSTVSVAVTNNPPDAFGDTAWTIRTYKIHPTATQFTYLLQVATGYNNPEIAIRNKAKDVWGGWTRLYSTYNTTKDSNGFIKAASPVVKVFADKVELNADAESQNVTYKKNGIGDYTITTVSGLSTDGWYIELPKDMNGNPKVAVTLEETNGVISLKSYKRIFSMETFTFEPDLDNPLDIPDTRWIDLRLNEIHVENEYGNQPEEVDLDK